MAKPQEAKIENTSLLHAKIYRKPNVTAQRMDYLSGDSVRLTSLDTTGCWRNGVHPLQWRYSVQAEQRLSKEELSQGTEYSVSLVT